MYKIALTAAAMTLAIVLTACGNGSGTGAGQDGITQDNFALADPQGSARDAQTGQAIELQPVDVVSAQVRTAP